jgi:hypothetical protein
MILLQIGELGGKGEDGSFGHKGHIPAERGFDSIMKGLG